MKRITKLTAMLAAFFLLLPSAAGAAAPWTLFGAQAPSNSPLIGWKAAADQVLTELPGVLIALEIEIDDGKPYFEIEVIREDGRGYETKVDMITGKVLRKEDEGVAPHHEDYLSVAISAKHAVALAQKSLPGSMCAGFELDRTRDGLHYNLDMVDSGGIEQDILINAQSGQLQHLSGEYDSSAADNLIGLSTAQSAALTAADGDAAITAKLEQDDGAWIYEIIAFGRDALCYEVTVNAETGAIIEMDVED